MTDAEKKQKHPYVIFEGMDGSGKSTLSRKVAEKLNATLLPFPTHGGPVGRLIRQCFSGEVTLEPHVIGYLMVADGLDAEPFITRQLEDRPVVADRHTTVSGWVYQTDVYSIDALLGLQQRGQFRHADVTFIIDVPENVAEERMKARGGPRNELYEKQEPGYVTSLRRRYLAYAFMHEDTVLLDGTRPVEQLVEDVLKVLTALEGS